MNKKKSHFTGKADLFKREKGTSGEKEGLRLLNNGELGTSAEDKCVPEQIGG